MEKAILKTLIYSDIFDYPMKAYEIHKWLIGKGATLFQVEKGLERLIKKRRVQQFKDYYFLKNNKQLVLKRERREKQSKKYLIKAKIFTQVLKIIPWIKLVGISGGLALNNASMSDDIDLFIITSKNRLWISRILAILMLDLWGVRRKPLMKKSQVAGKLCLNIFLEQERLEQENKDIFVSHEVLQMKVIWQRQGVYTKYLSDNEWAFNFLPNWIGDNFGRQPHSLARQRKRPVASRLGYAHFVRLGLAASGGSLPPLLGVFEDIAKWLQLKIMQKSQGLERIEEGGLYFHPNDVRGKILKIFKKKISKT